MANDYDAQVKVCAGLLEQFKAQLQQTAQSEMLRLHQSKIDAIVAQLNATIGNDDVIDDSGPAEKSWAALVSDAANLVSQASTALNDKDFGMFTTRLFQAVSCHTHVLVGIAKGQKIEVLNEQSYKYAEAIPKIKKSAHESVGRSGGNTKNENDKDGKQAAIAEIHQEFLRWVKNPAAYSYKTDPDFARKAAIQFVAYATDGSITELTYRTVREKVKEWRKQLNTE